MRLTYFASISKLTSTFSHCYELINLIIINLKRASNWETLLTCKHLRNRTWVGWYHETFLFTHDSVKTEFIWKSRTTTKHLNSSACICEQKRVSNFEMIEAERKEEAYNVANKGRTCSCMDTMCIPKISAKPNKRTIKHMQGELFVHVHLWPPLKPGTEWRHESLPCHNAEM